MEETVADVMNTNLVKCNLGDTIAEVANILIKNNISSVVVDDWEGIVGIVTERDFVKIWDGKNPCTAADLMHTELLSIEKESTIQDAVEMMGRHHIRHLLVRDGDEIVGIVSLRDILLAAPESIRGYMEVAV